MHQTTPSTTSTTKKKQVLRSSFFPSLFSFINSHLYFYALIYISYQQPITFVIIDMYYLFLL